MEPQNRRINAHNQAILDQSRAMIRGMLQDMYNSDPQLLMEVSNIANRYVKRFDGLYPESSEQFVELMAPRVGGIELMQIVGEILNDTT